MRNLEIVGGVNMKKNMKRFGFMALVVLGILLVFAGCSQGSESSGGTATSSVASVKIVAIDAVNQLRSDCSSATYTGGGDGGVLAARVDNDIVLYTPDWFTSTMTLDTDGTIEYLIKITNTSTKLASNTELTGTVVAVFGETDTSGSANTAVAKAGPPAAVAWSAYGTTLSSDTVVLSVTSAGSESLGELAVGDTVSLEVSVDSTFSDALTIVGGGRHDGGPLLVQDGVAAAEESAEMQAAYGSSSWYSFNPRTAIGVKQDGSWFLFTCDGRNAGGAKGMEIEDMKQLMLDLDAYDAFNLDGGGSTQFVVNDGSGTFSLGNTPSVSATTGRFVAQGLFVVVPTSTVSSTPTTTTGSESVTFTHSGYAGTKTKYTLATGVEWDHYVITKDVSTTASDGTVTATTYTQVVNTMSVAPTTATSARLVIGLNQNGYAFGGNITVSGTVTSQASNVLAKAAYVAANQIDTATETVVGGTNGDFYDTVEYSGVGYAMQNGKWIATGEYGEFLTGTTNLYTKKGYALGVKSDATAFMGQPAVSVSISYTE